MSYSLDDVLPARRPLAVEGNLFPWIISGHVPWILGLTWSWLAWDHRSLLIGAFAHIVGLLFAILAWLQRHRSAWGAKVVAWISTTLLGLGSLVLAVAVVLAVVSALTFTGADPDANDDMSLLIFAGPVIGAIVAAVVAVPTIGGFAAAISLARDLRRA